MMERNIFFVKMIAFMHELRDSPNPLKSGTHASSKHYLSFPLKTLIVCTHNFIQIYLIITNIIKHQMIKNTQECSQEAASKNYGKVEAWSSSDQNS